MNASELYDFLVTQLTAEKRKNCLHWKSPIGDSKREPVCRIPRRSKDCFCALEAQREITFLIEQAASHGWKLVPIEPTEDMIEGARVSTAVWHDWKSPTD